MRPSTTARKPHRKGRVIYRLPTIFAREVGNVVVEFGSAARQDVIDRYVAGESVPYTELRTVWTDTIGWGRGLPGIREVLRAGASYEQDAAARGAHSAVARRPASGLLASTFCRRELSMKEDVSLIVEPSQVDGDSVLFLGPIESFKRSPPLPDIFLDAEYRLEVDRRFRIQMRQPLFAMAKDFSLEKSVYEVDLDAPGYAELIDAMFARHDVNRDGVVTADEYRDPIQR